MRADDGGRIGERGEPLEDDGVGRDLGVGHERAEAEPAVRYLESAKVVEPVDGDDALRERRLALARADDEVGPAGDRARAARQRRQRLVHRGSRDVRGGHSARPEVAAQTRSGVIGSSRIRLPTTCAIALAIAPGVGTVGGSPTPFVPRGPPF